MTDKLNLSNEEWRKRLTPEEFDVLRRHGTEYPGTGCFLGTKTPGTYVCAGCNNPLFQSGTKFESGTGWPSFTQALSKDSLTEIKDVSHGMVRTEVRCARCDGHLGHVFPDGPPPTGLRYCMNSVAMKHVPEGSPIELVRA
ncbi:peptide-methionine (R)-S-oxide reductase [Corallococcus praedator]|uniref:Peptide methionine sulfoxide reductase MsrB n=1 Tax=Corallococcus praedator TaxID=2316724 RepID=A0ABX9QF43_9BACT|nr:MULTISPECIES: peptide-methionine (R)-S-oxide reductase MsrB [Corallococcus]RKH11271.1 peptide-methionine (R)-S-oxide reductase [Corallococcus sp. CA047B]RKH26440.1 peptide-methionine (R)-S-oxide reductase [Corallococcus sp. CA031C]RKI06233.1 peptide-methionine (R)-S-oxide reductase [Corallococcus praedator]